MKTNCSVAKSFRAAVLACAATTLALADTSTNSVPIPALEQSSGAQQQNWNWHVQNTEIVQGYPGFPAQYSGPNSLPSGGETRETISLDLMAGVRLWSGAEVHIDGLMWQGFGLNNTLGAEGFPNGEAYRIGTAVPNGAIARLFIRQTIGLGGGQEDVPDSQLTLAGKQDISRLTLTLGRFSAADIFDQNAYANDPRTQFMNWALVNNEAWDYAADSIGYTTGLAVELNQPKWTLRYGFFQVPHNQNGLTAEDSFFKWPYDPSADGSSQDGPFLRAWAMVTEFERRYSINDHPGTIRFLAFLNKADMASYSAATAILKADGPGADISAAGAYRYKYGFGLNWEQEIAKNVGIFSRLGWNDGQEQGWMFSDVDYAASLGLSIKGEAWHRPDDTFGLAGAFNGISKEEQEFLAAGGTGILAGDGKLNYGWEKILETYYDFQIWKTIHASLDYQFITDPAFNRDRGPVSVFGARLHWEF
jgi:high affinity Mn2+ porin